MRAEEKTLQGRTFSTPVKITAALLIAFSLSVFIEAASRIVYAYRDDIASSSLFAGITRKSLDLDPYEIQSPRGGRHWTLRPGYQSSLARLLIDKKILGRDVGLIALEAIAKEGPSDNKDIFRINKDGFKGDELDPAHSLSRVLVLGDSVTFGLAHIDYPEALRRRLLEKGIKAEVINGGVEGYTSRNLLLEMDRYKSLKPEIAIIHIGWNELFNGVPWPGAWENRLRIVWLIKQSGKGLQMLVGDPKPDATKLYNRVPHPVRDSDEVIRLESYEPPFIGQISQLIDEFQSIGTKIILVTLPGLFTMQEIPTLKMPKVAYLPPYTDNPYVLAKLAERYNVALKSLAKKKKVDLLDLAQWSMDSLQPRETFFLDSVHFTVWGLERVGVYMADWIAGHVNTLRRNGSASTL
jgi:lysophospholipase L1-like esterase